MTSGSLISRSTVPRRGGDPGTAAGADRPPGGAGLRAVVEEPVHGRARTGDVRAKRAQLAQLGRERRRRQIVRGQLGQVARAPDGGQPVEERAPPRLVAGPAVALVETGIDGRGRLLLLPVRN